MRTLEYVRAEDRISDQAAPSGGTLDPAPLIGTWLATDKQTVGVVRIEICQRECALFVHVFGPDPAEPYDWGEVEAKAFGCGPTAGQAVAFTATFDFGFLVTMLAGRASNGILTLDTFNAFIDASGRSNYFGRDFYHR